MDPKLKSRQRERGYSLAALIVMLTVLNVMIAAALPLWSHAARREKEEELIFRGLQYAEAIRVFQRRFGRSPARLEELLETEPRSIRQLWEDPMSEGGAWGLLVQGAPQRNPPLRNQQPTSGGQPSGEEGAEGQPAPGSQGPGGRPPGGQVVAIPPAKQEEGRPRAVTTGGQLVGVYSASSETAIRTFLDRDTYEQWHFIVSIIPVPAVSPDGSVPLPSVNSKRIGRPFRDGLQPQLPATPGAGPGGRQPTRPDLSPTGANRSGGNRPLRPPPSRRRNQ